MPFLIIIFVLLCNFAWAAPPPQPVSGLDNGRFTMNGLSYGMFAAFFKKWHFVTVRYRKDTGEMRFVYANDIAWKAMQEGNVKDYPEGAAFGKVGVMTQDDPAFTSSAVPSGAQRYQIMLRQHGRHPETGNWTYAIFLNDLRVHGPDSDAEKAAACAACHAIVPERGDVFSQPISLPLGGALNDASMGHIPSNRITFRTVKRTSLPKGLLDQLPKNIMEVRAVEGPLVDHLFVGTLDEIRPTLSQETLRSHMPAVLISKNGKRFSAIYMETEKPCAIPRSPAEDKPITGRMMRSFYTPDAPQPGQPVFSQPYCQPVH